jgi:ribosomal protein S18 acetylase RimI-like enzyme
MVTLVRPSSTHEWQEAARLVEEYAASLAIALDFQDFEHERTHLVEEYGGADSAFLLASQEGEFIGCGALRRFSESACEMKRLYVAPQGRGQSIGRMLASGLIEEARSLGYQTMLLDTLPSMQQAQALYASLGFKVVLPYRFNPVEGTVFLARDL